MGKRKPPKNPEIPDDKGKPLYRVRGAANVKERADWPYAIPHQEWIDRLNFVRRRLGDPAVSRLLGYSVNEARKGEYRSVRRLASGDRLPDSVKLAAISQKWRELNEQRKLVKISEEIKAIIDGRNLKQAYQSKIMAFLTAARPHVYRIDPPKGLPVKYPVYPRGIAMQAVDAAGRPHPESAKAIALIIMESNDLRSAEPAALEVYWIVRAGAPHLGIVQNAIATWLEILNDRTTGLAYMAFAVRGVWFSYV